MTVLGVQGRRLRQGSVFALQLQKWRDENEAARFRANRLIRMMARSMLKNSL